MLASVTVMQQLLVLHILLTGQQVHLGHGKHFLARIETKEKGDEKSLLIETERKGKESSVSDTKGMVVYLK